MSEVRRTYLAMLLAVLDGDCDARVVELLADHRHAIEVAHHAAHRMVDSIDDDDHDEMRDDIATELLDLANEDG